MGQFPKREFFAQWLYDPMQRMFADAYPEPRLFALVFARALSSLAIVGGTRVGSPLTSQSRLTSPNSAASIAPTSCNMVPGRWKPTRS